MEEGKVPALRFKGFDDDWKTQEVGDLGDIITGSTPSTSVSEYYDGDLPFVSPADINGNRYIEETRTTVSLSGFAKGRKIRRGSTLFVCIGSTIGKIGQAKVDCITNQQINAVAPLQDDDDFVFSLLQMYADDIGRLAAEQAVPILNKTTFSKYQLKIPSLAEQQKIASFFTAIDQKLAQLRQKKSLLERYKKGVMQRLFSQALRFRDEDGNEYPEWKRKQGNELFDSVSNKEHNSDLPILAITQEHGAIPRDLIDYQISVTDKSVESYKVVEVGDFIISLRSFQGGIEYSNYKGICSPAYIILRANTEINNQFYKYYLKTENYIKQLNKKLEGIRDGKMISYKYFSNVDLPYPSIEEQTKIATFLSALDDKISQTITQTKATERWKGGLLQKMFC